MAPWIYDTVRVIGFVSATIAMLRRDLKERKTGVRKALSPRSWSPASVAILIVALVGAIVLIVWAAIITP